MCSRISKCESREPCESRGPRGPMGPMGYDGMCGPMGPVGMPGPMGPVGPPCDCECGKMQHICDTTIQAINKMQSLIDLMIHKMDLMNDRLEKLEQIIDDDSIHINI